MRKFTLLVLAGLVCLSLAAVPAMAAKTIRVGASPTPHAEILRACEGILKEKGYNLEIVEYDGAFCSIKYIKRVSNRMLSSMRRRLPECFENANSMAENKRNGL